MIHKSKKNVSLKSWLLNCLKSLFYVFILRQVDLELIKPILRKLKTNKFTEKLIALTPNDISTLFVRPCRALQSFKTSLHILLWESPLLNNQIIYNFSKTLNPKWWYESSYFYWLRYLIGPSKFKHLFCSYMTVFPSFMIKKIWNFNIIFFSQ